MSRIPGLSFGNEQEGGYGVQLAYFKASLAHLAHVESYRLKEVSREYDVCRKGMPLVWGLSAMKAVSTCCARERRPGIENSVYVFAEQMKVETTITGSAKVFKRDHTVYVFSREEVSKWIHRCQTIGVE